MKQIELIHKERNRKDGSELTHMSLTKASKVQAFHKSFPQYEETPLVELAELAKELNVKRILVKDEAFRFNLNAFKVLGGSYAIANIIAERLGKNMDDITFGELVSEETREKLGDLTFISATDGNHGRGIAWMASQLKMRSIIYMPKGSAKERLDNIKQAGAEAYITEFNYDETVHMVDELARKNGWVMVQDTAWEGYEKIPTWIMQGYMTMAYEAYQQMNQEKPTHIFMQAGVGAFAGSVQGFFASVYGTDRPISTIVEPDQAACYYKTVKADDGKIHPVTGEMNTIMAGLACGEPATVSWEIIQNYADNYVSCPDYVAAQGMRILGNPLPKDTKVTAGESGAAGFGFFSEVIRNKEYAWMKDTLSIDENSVLLFFNTEGATDRENYMKVVWDGCYTK